VDDAVVGAGGQTVEDRGEGKAHEPGV
jgi:hypothetical protein